MRYFFLRRILLCMRPHAPTLLLYMCAPTRQGLCHSAPHPAIYASSCHYYYSTICVLAYYLHSTICVLAYYLHTSCILVQKAERYCSSRTCVKKKWKKKELVQGAEYSYYRLPALCINYYHTTICVGLVQEAEYSSSYY